MMNNWFISVNPSQFGELKVWFAPMPPNLRLQSTVQTMGQVLLILMQILLYIFLTHYLMFFYSCIIECIADPDELKVKLKLFTDVGVFN